VWCGVVWCGVVWCGVVWCGAARRGAARCGVVCVCVQGKTKVLQKLSIAIPC
jgi:hypothetical protein